MPTAEQMCYWCVRSNAGVDRDRYSSISSWQNDVLPLGAEPQGTVRFYLVSNCKTVRVSNTDSTTARRLGWRSVSGTVWLAIPALRIASLSSHAAVWPDLVSGDVVVPIVRSVLNVRGKAFQCFFKFSQRFFWLYNFRNFLFLQSIEVYLFHV